MRTTRRTTRRATRQSNEARSQLCGMACDMAPGGAAEDVAGSRAGCGLDSPPNRTVFPPVVYFRVFSVYFVSLKCLFAALVCIERV